MNTVLWDGDALLAGRMYTLYYMGGEEDKLKNLRTPGKKDNWKVEGKPVLAFAFTGHQPIEKTIVKMLEAGLFHSSKLNLDEMWDALQFDAILVTEDQAYHWTVWKVIDAKASEVFNVLRPAGDKVALGEYAHLANAIMAIGKNATATADTIRNVLKFDSSNGKKKDQIVWRRSDKLQFGDLRDGLFELSKLTLALAEGDLSTEEVEQKFQELGAEVTKALQTYTKATHDVETGKAVAVVDKPKEGLFIPGPPPPAVPPKFWKNADGSLVRMGPPSEEEVKKALADFSKMISDDVQNRNIATLTDHLGEIWDILDEYDNSFEESELLDQVRRIKRELRDLDNNLVPEYDAESSPVKEYLREVDQELIDSMPQPARLEMQKQANRDDLFQMLGEFQLQLSNKRPKTLEEFKQRFARIDKAFQRFMDRVTRVMDQELVDDLDNFTENLVSPIDSMADAQESYKAMQASLHELQWKFNAGKYENI